MTILVLQGSACSVNFTHFAISVKILAENLKQLAVTWLPGYPLFGCMFQIYCYTHSGDNSYRNTLQSDPKRSLAWPCPIMCMIFHDLTSDIYVGGALKQMPENLTSFWRELGIGVLLCCPQIIIQTFSADHSLSSVDWLWIEIGSYKRGEMQSLGFRIQHS